MSDVRQLDPQKLAQLSAADQIDLICDAFEDAWTRGDVPRLEDYLDQCDAHTRESLLAELLLVDREFRIQRGESVSRQNYQERFPDYSTLIESLEFSTIAERRRARPSAISDGLGVLAGTNIAHFELLEQLGRGASGTVWKARDTRLRRLVAIKIPRHEMLSGAELERFLREGQMCAQLRHPNIVTVHEVGDEHGRLFIATALIDGVDLRQRLRERHPTPQETAELAAELAEALHHAHEQGVIHRDLKPANVLVDRDGRPHIADFGLAKWSTGSIEKTVEGNVLGTPAYMSPEQARGDAYRVDRRTDVYALGAVLYEMLTGQPPFQGDIAAVVHQVVHEEPIPPRTIARAIPRDLETICIKAMAKVPTRRYPSAQEMAVDLRRYLRGDSIIARRVNVLERGWRWLRRRPSTAALLLLSMAVVIAGMSIASLQQKNYRLQGYRPVLVRTVPEGAKLAFVPIDPRTGEPNPEEVGVIRPQGTTPLRTLLKPSEYLVEAVLAGDGGSPDFAEVYMTVIDTSMHSKQQMQRNRQAGKDEDLITFEIQIRRSSEVIADMVAVEVDEELRRQHPLLPRLLFIDAKETTPTKGQNLSNRSLNNNLTEQHEQSFFSIERAKSLANTCNKRLPSAIEYDAIAKAANERELRYVASGHQAVMDDLFGGLAEWSTTTYDFPGLGRRTGVAKMRSMRVLKGYSDADKLPGLLRSSDGYLLAPSGLNSPMIGFRGVRSGAPRFVKP